MSEGFFSENALEEFQEELRYHFEKPALLEEALTHSSYANEHLSDEVRHNERLEFLGDAVLGAVISRQLYLYDAVLPEGKMTRIRSLTVREESLAEAAAAIHLTKYMRFGQGEERSNGRERMSNAADAMEALFGAIFIDGGFDAAERVILESLSDIFERALTGKLIYDYKSRLYEYLQATENNPDVEFVLLNTDGPAHDRRFTCAVRYNGKLYPEATASSKKSAEQDAAHLFLDLVQAEAGDKL